MKDYQINRKVARMLARIRMDYQKIRKSIDNRIGRKADGTDQDITVSLPLNDMEMLKNTADRNRKEEEFIEKQSKEVIKRFTIYEWLEKEVKGISTIGILWIVGEIDIHIATTVSKIWQFCGFNPGIVQGRKSVKKKDYKPEMGKIIKELPPTKDGEKRYEILTNVMVRGDKKTEGFLCPYNQRLRTVLMGVIASGFIKSQNSYTIDYYYNMHIPEKYRKDKEAMSKKPELAGQYGRYDSSEEIIQERRGGGKVVSIPWKDATDGHREMAARRYMMKMFLKDLYVTWRELEGLEVREPYSKEYLGKEHHRMAA